MKKIFLAAVLMLFLCSCSYTEPSAIYTVSAIGLQKNGENMQITLKIKEMEDSFKISGEAESLDSAMDNIKTKLSKQPYFRHCQLRAFGGLGGEPAEEVISFCEKLGIPIKTKIVYVNDIDRVFEEEREGDIISLLKHSYEEFGFGGNTALFEIDTALLTNAGNFALPLILIEGENIKLDGLLRYKGGKPYEKLNLEQSIKYAQEVTN